VLVTGVTGFVGGALAAALLQDSRVDRLVALVRARDQRHAQERAEWSVQRFGRSCRGQDRLQVVCGSLEDASLDVATVRSLTHVVHAAAHTSFLAVHRARATNIAGSRLLATRVMHAPAFERFLFVSTAYRCGVIDATTVVEDHPASPDHVAEYTRTKAEAEAALALLAGLPLVIARPSIIVGHTRLGVEPSASIYWYYRALALAGMTPFPTSRRRDIVPVDWVASALTCLLFKSALHQRCYHLSAGDVCAVTWSRIHETFARFGQAAPTTQAANASDFGSHHAWSTLALSQRTRAALKACAKFSAVPIEAFSNQRVLAEGIAPPPPFDQYLPRCIETGTKPLNDMARDDA
jgi:nucleoside-diphosphate-sugar epimerase